MAEEFDRIAAYFAPLAGPEGLGLKDDAAVLLPPAGRELVLTVDQMVEGVHFLPGDAPDLVARKLLRRNLSDLAAMGATPLGYLLTMALPPGVDTAWLAGFAQGLRQDQEFFGLRLFGGDSSSCLAHISLTATLLGHLAPGAALRRNGARAGDEIWVTGTIGDAALGLRARRGTLRDSTGFLTNRSLLPEPRIGLALTGIATAAIDISDGLIQDLGHLCRQSGLGAVIHADLIPTSPEAAGHGVAFLEARLTEGDDYELLLAVPPGKTGLLQTVLGQVRGTMIGRFNQGAAVTLLNHDGLEIKILKAGWTHF